MLKNNKKSFLKKIDSLNISDFKISSEDVLKLQIKTTGQTNYECMTAIRESRYKLIFIDTGGQRNERLKWDRTLGTCNSVIYVVALSEFDQKCYEDDMTNRMQESLEEFDKRINSSDLENKVVIFILNKLDIFKEKIKKKSLKIAFPDYDGKDGDEKAAIDYVKKQFVSKDKSKKERIFIFELDATDEKQVENVFRESLKLSMQ
jgi:guanine nucleotide-binding protein G(i) subunit alpha